MKGEEQLPILEALVATAISPLVGLKVSISDCVAVSCRVVLRQQFHLWIGLSESLTIFGLDSFSIHRAVVHVSNLCSAKNVG